MLLCALDQFEFWMRVGDRHHPFFTPLAISEADALENNPPIWQDNGAEIAFDSTRFYFYRGQNSMECVADAPPNPSNQAACLTVLNTGGWEHIALSWEAATGLTCAYRNGQRMMCNFAADLRGSRFLQRLTESPSFIIGQEPDGTCSGAMRCFVRY